MYKIMSVTNKKKIDGNYKLKPLQHIYVYNNLGQISGSTKIRKGGVVGKI